MQKTISIVVMLLVICSACWCIYRDIQIEKQYTGDLRNRIVGARLQKDGIPPYFYKWKKTDGIRYYDPQNFDTLKVSNITATPLFHQLLYPLADLPQRTISKIWLVIGYIVLFIITFFFSFIAKSKEQKVAVIITALLFLYLNAWKSHIAAGQIYLFFTFFSVLFFFLITKRNNYRFAIPAGLCAATLVLIRPNTIFFFLPFLFLINKYTLKYKLIFFVSLLALIVVEFSSSQRLLYWQDFRYAMSEQLKSHQGLGAAVQYNEPDPALINWEGWDMHKVAEEAARFPYLYNKEHGNVFVFVNHLFHVKTPVWILAATSLLLMSLLVFFFYLKRGAGFYDLSSITLLAFSVYMITDFFSPIHRFLYNGVQWLFPLMIIASGFNRRYILIYAGLAIGLLLNSLNLSFIPLTQTLGEYIIFLFVIIYIFKYKPGTSF